MTLDASAPRWGDDCFRAKLAIVSGAASGIGREVALSLARQGCNVAAIDRDEPGLQSLRSALRPTAAAFDTYVCDLAAPERVASVVESIVAERGCPDFLVNAAGILRPGRALELELEDWEATLRVNCTGTMLLSQAVAKHMVSRGRGAIVTIASNAASTPRVGMGAYAASKAAIAQYTKCLGLELAAQGIRCNVVSPGSTLTPMLTQLNSGRDATDAGVRGAPEHFRLGIPLGRVAQANDVCNAVLFLLSPLAQHITLHDLTIDGGATLGT